MCDEQRLRTACGYAQSDQSLCKSLEDYMTINLLAEQHLEFLSLNRVPTRQGEVREIWFFFKVREKSGNSVKWSGKLENLQKSGKSQGILKSCLVNPSKIKRTNIR